MALTKVSSSLVSDNAITTGKLVDGGVHSADIADVAVTSAKIANNAILTQHIDDAQVTTDQLGADAVTAAKIADDAISEEHLDVTVITSLTAVTAATGDLLMVADVSDSNNLKKIPVSSILAGTHTGGSSGTHTGAVNTSGTINSGALGVTGNIVVSGTVDGIDIAARDAVLTSTTTTAGAALPKAGGTMTGNLTVNAIVDADNFKINNAQGTDGQVLTSTGSGVAWEDAGYSGGNFEITNADQDNGVVLTLKNTYNGSSWANGDIGGAINFTSSDAGVTQPIRAQIKTVTANALSDPYPFYTDMVFSTTTLNNSTTERMRIDYLGRVGIGTATPGTNHAKANKLVVGSGSAGGMAIFNGTAEGWYAFSRANANNTDAYDGGMSYNGDRDLKFHTNAGATRMTIDGTGNVGIGETSPDAPLHITSNTPIIVFDESDASQEYRIGSFGGAFALYDSTDSAYRLIVDGSGNVGIGETTPDDTLHVNKSGGTARIRIGSGNDAYYAQKGYLGDTWVFGSGETGDVVTSTISGGAFTSSNAGGAFIWKTATSGGTPAELMRINSSGNVGIGVNDPLSKLHVHNASSATNRIARFESTIDNLNEYTAITVGKQGSHTASMGIQLLASDQMFLGVTNNGNTFNPGTGGTGTGIFLNKEGTIRTPGQPYTYVNRSGGNQTVGAGAWTNWTFANTVENNGTSMRTADGVITFPTAGVYLITGLISIENVSATNYLQYRAIFGSHAQQFLGINVVAADSSGANNYYGYDVPVSFMVKVAASETMNIQVFSGGGNMTVRGGTDSNIQVRLMG